MQTSTASVTLTDNATQSYEHEFRTENLKYFILKSEAF